MDFQIQMTNKMKKEIDLYILCNNYKFEDINGLDLVNNSFCYLSDESIAVIKDMDLLINTKKSS